MDVDTLLKTAGWAAECQSPFEIRHEDGSFATGQAAQFVVQTLADDGRLAAMTRALTVIEGAAALAKQAGDGYANKLWVSVQSEARQGLGLDPLSA